MRNRAEEEEEGKEKKKEKENQAAFVSQEFQAPLAFDLDQPQT